MAIPLRLDPTQVADFRLICELGQNDLRRVLEKLRQLKLTPGRPDKLFNAVATALNENKAAAEAVVRQALILYGSVRLGGAEVAQLQEGIREALQATPDWSDQDRAKWQRIEATFGELLSLPIVHLTAGAIDLSYEYANLCRGARILTDIRPIFDAQGTAISGAVVSQTLRLQFENVDGWHELYIAMDESDIGELARQCERALRKAQIAKDMMDHGAKVPTMISGEDAGA